MITFTLDQIRDALNGACNDIEDTAGLPETGAIDALNLLVNATLHYLEHPTSGLKAAVAANYGDDTTLDEIVDWIGS